MDEHTINPWGETRDLLHAAYIAYVVATYAGKTRTQPLSFTDCVKSMNASLYELMHPDEIAASEVGPDDIFSKLPGG